MNEREAREIVKDLEDEIRMYGESRTSTVSRENRYIFAKGYLEAIEKAKGLVEALEHIQSEEMNMKPPFQRARKFLQKEDMVKLADEALAQYEKIK